MVSKEGMLSRGLVQNNDGGVRRGRSVGFTKNGNGDREGCDVGSQTDLVMRQKDVII